MSSFPSKSRSRLGTTGSGAPKGAQGHWCACRRGRNCDCENCNNNGTADDLAERVRQLDEFFTWLLKQLQAKLAEENKQLRLFPDEEDDTGGKS